jgi:hypothetical protein
MDVLEQLHQRLVEVLRQGWGAADLLTVADVYQHLIPYRQVRGELGLSELKEYEHALLRLLSGERDLLRVEVPEVIEEFRRELRSANPILGIYRDYAAAPLSVNLDAAGRRGGADALLTPEPASAEDRIASGTEDEADETLPEPLPTFEASPAPTSAPREAGPGPSPEALRAPTACWDCQQPLPAGRDVRFCPHCGACQVPVPCVECGSSLDPQWTFCIQCGARKPEPYDTRQG